jgi:serine/threonine-protein kinase
VRPGEVLAGKYRVERILASGGMGVVVAAHHLQLDEKVALKFLLPESLASQDAMARFDREARAAVKIKSEHVARVTDVGRLETGAPYIVMEYLEGRDLDAWLEKLGPIPVEQAVEFVLQACEAIAEAHVLGIVHRDLKPANLFCVRRADGLLSIKVLDFGISKVSGPAQGKGVTTATSTVGSPLYMSPEQLRSATDVDTRTDIWALGVILYEICSGRVPFDAETTSGLAIEIATAPPVPLSRVRPGLPPGFEEVVMRCLEKDRDARFQTVADLAVALRDYGPKRATHSVERILGTMRAAGMSIAVLPPSGRHRSQYAETVADGAAGVARGPVAGPRATVATWGRTGSTPRRGRTALAAMIVGAGVLVVGASGAVWIGKRVSAPAALASTSLSPPTESLRASSPPAARESPAVDVASGSPPTVDVTDLPSARPPAAVLTAVRAAPRPAGDAGPAPAAKGNCSPPYFVDSAGDRQYKPECL